MKINKITVEYGQTYNLGDYSNIRPSITLEADLEADDNPAGCIELLFDQAKAVAHAQIDEALEADDKQPFYYAGPRYSLWVCPSNVKLALIAPSEWNENPTPWLYKATKRRLEIIHKYIAEGYQDYQIIDCSDGDLSKIPMLENFQVFKSRYHKVAAIFIKGDVERIDLPGGTDVWEYPSYYTGLFSLLMPIWVEEHSYKNCTFIDCTVDYLEGIAKLPPPPEPEPATEKPKKSRKTKKQEETEDDDSL